jgi:hypothetical protein
MLAREKIRRVNVFVVFAESALQYRTATHDPHPTALETHGHRTPKRPPNNHQPINATHNHLHRAIDLRLKEREQSREREQRREKRKEKRKKKKRRERRDKTE